MLNLLVIVHLVLQIFGDRHRLTQGSEPLPRCHLVEFAVVHFAIAVRIDHPDHLVDFLVGALLSERVQHVPNFRCTDIAVLVEIVRFEGSLDFFIGEGLHIDELLLNVLF